MVYCADNYKQQLLDLGAVEAVPLSTLVSFRVGGPAALLLCPKGEEELLSALKLCEQGHSPVALLGNGTNVQDGSCVHVTHDTGPTHIGSDVTIGHNVTVHACTIHDGALIGMGATLLDGCEIGEGALIAAGALVLQNTKVGAGELWGGVPAKFIKMAKPGMAGANARHYVEYAKWYIEEQNSEKKRQNVL